MVSALRRHMNAPAYSRLALMQRPQPWDLGKPNALGKNREPLVRPRAMPDPLMPQVNIVLARPWTQDPVGCTVVPCNSNSSEDSRWQSLVRPMVAHHFAMFICDGSQFLNRWRSYFCTFGASTSSAAPRPVRMKTRTSSTATAKSSSENGSPEPGGETRRALALVLLARGANPRFGLPKLGRSSSANTAYVGVRRCGSACLSRPNPANHAWLSRAMCW